MSETHNFSRGFAPGCFLRAALWLQLKLILPILLCAITILSQTAFIRINQVGYLPADRKAAIVFSSTPIADEAFLVRNSSGSIVWSGRVKAVDPPTWGPAFSHYYELDFSAMSAERSGTHTLQLVKAGVVSREFNIGPYAGYHEDLLHFMRQQRCGYNPFLDMVCHKRDGRSFYGPMPDETYVDASGGWHDAGDQLKYLITASNATTRMMLAYELEKAKFGDLVDEMGREDRPNKIPDILDEAKWGLDWIHKLHPKADQLFHQVADDRDHRGFKIPNNDNADYGWGPNSYRPFNRCGVQEDG